MFHRYYYTMFTSSLIKALSLSLAFSLFHHFLHPPSPSLHLPLAHYVGSLMKTLAQPLVKDWTLSDPLLRGLPARITCQKQYRPLNLPLMNFSQAVSLVSSWRNRGVTLYWKLYAHKIKIHYIDFIVIHFDEFTLASKTTIRNCYTNWCLAVRPLEIVGRWIMELQVVGNI